MLDYLILQKSNDIFPFFCLRYCSTVGPFNVLVDSTSVVIAFTNYPLGNGKEFSLDVFIGKRTFHPRKYYHTAEIV